jgi:hypothetical protein
MVETAVAVALLAALVKKLMDLVKYFRAGADGVNGYTTILASMVIGVLAVMIAARSDFASGISLGGVSLADANFWSQLFIGLTVASAAGVITDFFKSLNQSETAEAPPLVPESEELPPEG